MSNLQKITTDVTTFDYVHRPTPSIRETTRQNGLIYAQAQLCEIIEMEFVKICGVANRMPPIAVKAIADKLIAEYDRLKPEDVILFLKKARAGEYGKFVYYNMPELMGKFSAFMIDRAEYCATKAVKKKHSAEPRGEDWRARMLAEYSRKSIEAKRDAARKKAKHRAEKKLMEDSKNLWVTMHDILIKKGFKTPEIMQKVPHLVVLDALRAVRKK